jgi:hypothetical protein
MVSPVLATIARPPSNPFVILSVVEESQNSNEERADNNAE